MKRLILLTALLAGCAAHSRSTIPAGAHHKTEAVIRDITDPAHPVEVWRGTNLMNACGMRALFASAILGPYTSMGAASGSANTLGQVCAGTNSGTQKQACPFDDKSVVVVGYAATADCTAAATPWACCTGNGTGCTVSAVDQLMFGEGQPNGSLVNVASNFQTYVTNGVSHAQPTFPDAAPTLYWNGTTLEGMQWTATYQAGFGTGSWCEFGVRSRYLNPAGNAADHHCGPFEADIGGGVLVPPGWQLDHGVISPCLTKGGGSVFQITVTVTFV